MTAPVRRAYVVRDATEDDLEAMVAVKLRGWADAYGPLIDPEILRPLLDPRQHLTRLRRLFHQRATLLLVAVERKLEVVLGFALTDMAHQPEPLLESLHVSAAVRGLGIGEVLMRATATRVAACGHTSMRLAVVESNRAARKFYERLGGELAGVERHLWGTATVPSAIYRWPDIIALAELSFR